jgi:hypothetical protein
MDKGDTSEKECDRRKWITSVAIAGRLAVRVDPTTSGKHSMKELGQGDNILKSIIFEVSLSSARHEKPWSESDDRETGTNPNPVVT